MGGGEIFVRLRSTKKFYNKRALIHLYMLHYKCARVPKRALIFTIIISAATESPSFSLLLSLSLSLSLSFVSRAAAHNILKTALFLLNSAARLLLFDFHNRRIDVRLDDLLEH